MKLPSPKPRRFRGTASGEGSGLGLLAATSLALNALVAALVVWLALSGPPERAAAPPAIVVKLVPAPAQTMPAPAADAGAGPSGETAGGPPATARRQVAPPREAETSERSGPGPGDATGAPMPSADALPRVAPAAPSAPDKAAPAAGPPAITALAALPGPLGGLRPAPDPDLVEKTRLGPLPRVAPDGRKPWRTYARPFEAGDRRPRVAIIVAGLGLSGAATEAAIQRLPGAVTLSFAPYAKGLRRWIVLARAAGHEVMLDLPMEPVTFPTHRLRPHTLLTSLSDDQNMDRLHWLLGRVTGYVGMVNQMGSRFTTSETHVRPILTELKQRGLLFVDSRSSLGSVAARLAGEIGLPRAVNNRFIDAEASREAIDTRLGELERIAHASGRALGIGAPFPVTLDRLSAWTPKLEGKGLTLAPVSALVRSQGN